MAFRGCHCTYHEAWSEKMKKTKEQSSAITNLKEEVGERFKIFRLGKKKSQNVLAKELQVHQTTVTNIEKGATFPKVSYLDYFFQKYGLNLNWLVSGYGKQYMEESEYKGASRIMAPAAEYDDGNKYEKHRELITLIRVPVIEQVILAKLSECKILFENDVKEFFDTQNKEKREKKRKASRTKVKK